MLTYEITTREDSDSDVQVRSVDCAYFQSDIHFVSFKDAGHKTVLAVPTGHVLSVELKQESDGSGQAGVRCEVRAPSPEAFAAAVDDETRRARART